MTCFVGTQEKNYDIEATETSESQGVRVAKVSRHDGASTAPAGQGGIVTTTIGDSTLLETDEEINTKVAST